MPDTKHGEGAGGIVPSGRGYVELTGRSSSESMGVVDFRASAIGRENNGPEFQEIAGLKSTGKKIAVGLTAHGMLTQGMAAAVLLYALLEEVVGAEGAIVIALLIGVCTYLGKLTLVSTWNRPTFEKLAVDIGKDGVVSTVTRSLGFTSAPQIEREEHSSGGGRHEGNAPSVASGLRHAVRIGVGGVDKLAAINATAAFSYLGWASSMSMGEMIKPFSYIAADVFQSPWFWAPFIPTLVVCNLGSTPFVLSGGIFYYSLMLKRLTANDQAVSEHLFKQAQLNFTINRLVRAFDSLSSDSENTESLKTVLKIFKVLIREGIDESARGENYPRSISALSINNILDQKVFWNCLENMLAYVKGTENLDLEKGLRAYATAENGFIETCEQFSIAAGKGAVSAERVKALGEWLVTGFSIYGLSNFVDVAQNMVNDGLSSVGADEEAIKVLGGISQALAVYFVVVMSSHPSPWGNWLATKALDLLNWVGRGPQCSRTAAIEDGIRVVRRASNEPLLGGTRVAQGAGEAVAETHPTFLMPESRESPQLLSSSALGLMKTSVTITSVIAGGALGYQAYVQAQQGIPGTIAAVAVSFFLEWPAFMDLVREWIESRIVEAEFGGRDAHRKTLISLFTFISTKLKTVGGGGFAVPEAPWVDKVLRCLEEPKVERHEEAGQRAEGPPVGAAATFLTASENFSNPGKGAGAWLDKSGGSPGGGSPAARDAFV